MSRDQSKGGELHEPFPPPVGHCKVVGSKIPGARIAPGFLPFRGVNFLPEPTPPRVSGPGEKAGNMASRGWFYKLFSWLFVSRGGQIDSEMQTILEDIVISENEEIFFDCEDFDEFFSDDFGKYLRKKSSP